MKPGAVRRKNKRRRESEECCFNRGFSSPSSSSLLSFVSWPPLVGCYRPSFVRSFLVYVCAPLSLVFTPPLFKGDSLRLLGRRRRRQHLLPLLSSALLRLKPFKTPQENTMNGIFSPSSSSSSSFSSFESECRDLHQCLNRLSWTQSFASRIV
jgi:hypothetical protein